MFALLCRVRKPMVFTATALSSLVLAVCEHVSTSGGSGLFADKPVLAVDYDVSAAIGALVEQGDILDRVSLTQSTRFAGVKDVFRLSLNGTNERALAVAQIRSNSVLVIDPSPRSFGGVNP